MKIIKATIFNKFPEIKFGFSTKIGLNRKKPFDFNMSYTVGDEKNLVTENRSEFFGSFGLNIEDVAYQKQTHSDIINVVEKGGLAGESDALITSKFDLGLAISSADCTAIFLYDPRVKVIAAVHSGWRGTQQGILKKTLQKLFEEFKASPENIFAYLAPSISQNNYEVGEEVAALFDPKYTLPKGDKYLLDVAGNNFNMLLSMGIPENNIEKSELCSYAEHDLHSYRRDGKKSGRAFGLIVMQG